MKPFVFRARAALDLRRRRDDEAQRELAAANGEVTRAQRALDEAVEAREAEFGRARDAHAAGGDLVAVEWYRNWITRQQRDVARCEDELTRRRDAAEAARVKATKTHIDVRVLEKLEERARRAYDAAARQEEQKAIDWLAVLRSYTGGDGQGSPE